MSNRETRVGIKWTTYSTIVLMVVGVLKISILTRYLVASDFGVVSLVTFVLGFVNLFMDVGITSAILHKQDISNNHYSSLYWLNIFFSILIFFILYILSGPISRFYSEPRLEPLISIMATSICFSALGNQFKTIKQKDLKFKFIAVVEILVALGSLLLSVALAILGYGILSLIYSTLFQYLLTNIIFFVYGCRNHNFLHFKLSDTYPYLKIGIYQVGGQIVNYFSKDFDVLLIGKFFGVDVLGGYSLAKQLVLRPMSVINPIVARIGAPILSKLQNDSSLLKDAYLKFFNIVSTINFVSYLLLALFSYPIVLILYGSQFTNITIYVQILCIYMFLRSLNSTVGSLVIATGKTNYEFYWNLVVLFVSPLPVFLGSQISILAVTLAMTICMVILSILCWKYLIFPMIKVSWKDYLGFAKPNISQLLKMLKSLK